MAPIVERAIHDGMQLYIQETEKRQEQIASEIIGRQVIGGAQINIYKSRARAVTIDQTVPDYEFYDLLRRGKAKGYYLGSLFCKPIEDKYAGWVFKNGLEVKLLEAGDPDNEEDHRNYTDGRLREFVASLLDSGASDEEEANDRDDASDALMTRLYKDGLGLGDQYVIVNMDGSLSVPSADTVDPERSPVDYRQLTAVTVTTKTGKVVIIDRYTAVQRTITIKENGQETSMSFDNPIGRIPVVHIAHGRSANETNGHPVHEPLLPLYDQYDDLIYKQLDGAKLLGNPIPTFEGMEDINQVITQNAPRAADTYQSADGTTETRQQLRVDQNSVVLVGKGGAFSFKGAAVGFTEDTKTALKSLFLLLLDHTGIPEFIWGNEIASGRSSSETQLDQWITDTQARQKDCGGWIIRLCKIWLQVTALVDPRIVLDKLTITWPPLIEEDEDVQLRRIELARRESLLTDKTALELLNLVKDPAKEVEEAQAEAKERREEMFPDGDSLGFGQRIGMNGQGQPQREGA
jgi:RecB family endonuclease NucS